MANLSTVAEDSVAIMDDSSNNNNNVVNANVNMKSGSRSSKRSASNATNSTADKSKMSRDRLIRYLNKAEKDLSSAKESVKTEKEAKRKLYSSLVKIAQELKKTKEEHADLQAIVETNASLEAKVASTASASAASLQSRSSDNIPLYYSNERPMFWREPQLLPGLTEYINNRKKQSQLREEISFTDLFLDVVVVTGFSRVGSSIHDYDLNWAFFCRSGARRPPTARALTPRTVPASL